VEAAYDSGGFRDDLPGRKRKIRGAPPTPFTLKIVTLLLKVMALGCPMDGMGLESDISQHMLAKSSHKLTGWMVDEHFDGNYGHMPSKSGARKCGECVVLAWAA
jgi:hypothetical protein